MTSNLCSGQLFHLLHPHQRCHAFTTDIRISLVIHREHLHARPTSLAAQTSPTSHQCLLLVHVLHSC